MTTFEDYLATLEKSEQREKMATLLTWIAQHYPDLTPVIKWKQPMFIEHGTYIIGLSASKHHFSLSPEAKTIRLFEDEIKAADFGLIARVPLPESPVVGVMQTEHLAIVEL